MLISQPNHTDSKWQYLMANFILLLALLAVATFFLQERFITLSGTDRMRLEMYKSTLNSTIEQYYILPYMLSIDKIINQSITENKDQQRHSLNERIEYLNNHLKNSRYFYP